MRSAMRSLTLPPALKSSTFAYTVASMPKLCGILLSLTSGVCPICCKMLSITTGGRAGFVMEAIL